MCRARVPHLRAFTEIQTIEAPSTILFAKYFDQESIEHHLIKYKEVLPKVFREISPEKLKLKLRILQIINDDPWFQFFSIIMDSLLLPSHPWGVFYTGSSVF